MNQTQAEANWEWDPKRGSIPFKRPRITPENIKLQQKLARPGTLIHWNGKPCARGRRRTDEKRDGNVTHLGCASHIGNVNCLACRRRYFKNKHRPTY